MRFLSVTLTDILAYEHSVPLNLSRTTPEKNLVLVWGRNGKGKTSFITALKLLFAGIAEERSRYVGFPPRPLPPGQFVLGDGEHWMGIINRRAARRATNDGGAPTASIEARWEQDGVEVTARREWSVLPTGGFEERVVLTEGGVRLTGSAATDRLAEFLPPEYVGFFFFDGEDIKSLAETAERKAIDFDQLLRIKFVAELASELEKAATERRRRTMKPEERAMLRKVEVDLEESRFAQRDANAQLSDIEDRLTNEMAKLRRAETIRDNLSSGATQAQREALEVRKKKLEREMALATADVVARVPEEIPVLANLQLLDAAAAEIEQRLVGSGAIEQRIINRVANDLPGWVRGVDVDLTDAGRDVMITALVAQVRAVPVSVQESGLFSSIGLARAERLLEQLRRFTGGGRDVRGAHVSLLLAIHRQRVELAEVDDELMRLRVGSEANVERYREIERQIRTHEDVIAQLNQDKGVQSARVVAAEKDERRLAQDLERWQAQHVRAAQDETEAREIERVVQALLDAREALRRTMRDEVQRLLNIRFHELVHDHALIAKIGIDDSYTMNFFDKQDRTVGRASLSSGIKQIAATALLWAMKDAAAHDVPVVIDTPLGRIDRENQDRMLANYYPNLSNQVVLLPTNAEIDERKKGMIKNLIADEYTIENDTGDSASIRPGPLVES